MTHCQLCGESYEAGHCCAGEPDPAFGAMAAPFRLPVPAAEDELPAEALAACAAVMEAEDELATARQIGLRGAALRPYRRALADAERAFRAVCEACTG